MSAPTMPPRMGPLMRSQVMGGPACSTVSRVMPGTTSIAARTSTRIWWAASTRSIATRFAASTSSRQSDASASAPSGGRQSTRRTGTLCAASAEAKSSGPTTTAPGGSSSKPRSAAMAALRERPRRLGGDPVAPAHDRAQTPERLLLLFEALRILVGPDDVRYDRHGPAVAARPRFVERWAQRAGRIGMGAITEDQIDENHRNVRIVSRLYERGVAAAGVDDRMGPSPRELLGAEIGESVPRPADDAPRLVAQGTTRIKAAHRAAGAARDRLWRSDRSGFATGDADCDHRRLFQRARSPDAIRRLPAVAEQAGHDRPACRDRGIERRGCHLRRRGLGDEQDHLRGGVSRQGLDRLQCGDAADLGVEVATAGADGVRDAAAQPVHQARHFLDAGSGG